MLRSGSSAARALYAALRQYEMASLQSTPLHIHHPLATTATTASYHSSSILLNQLLAAADQDDAALETESFSATELAGLAAQLADTPQPPGSSPVVGKGPLTAYNEGKEAGLLRKDPLQEATVHALQHLFDDLTKAFPPPASSRSGSGLTLVDASGSGNSDENDDGTNSNKRPWWTTLFGTSSTDLEASGDNADDFAPQIQGLYMFGGVGCGKTMLMDLFAACAPPRFHLVRTHFHDFMIDIHTKLRTHQHVSDPLALVADEVVASSKVLCLDEFFVTDVADAMILHRLFARLWDRGLVLVATSNRRPDALYEGGLQRALFMPFIHRLKAQCVVHDMASATDYRRLAQHRGGLYFTPPVGDVELHERFLELANNSPVVPQTVQVAMGRQLEMLRVGGCIVLFRFEELCDRPLGAADYIALANSKHTVALSGVPIFNGANRTAAYRFVTLIDVLYEHKVRLLCSAEGIPSQLFDNIKTIQEGKAVVVSGNADTIIGDMVVDDNLGFAKDRTVSRLTEMQSKEYLRAHATAHAPELLYALDEGEKQEKKRAER